jgi:hypothetical protein
MQFRRHAQALSLVVDLLSQFVQGVGGFVGGLLQGGPGLPVRGFQRAVGFSAAFLAFTRAFTRASSSAGPALSAAALAPDFVFSAAVFAPDLIDSPAEFAFSLALSLRDLSSAKDGSAMSSPRQSIFKFMR